MTSPAVTPKGTVVLVTLPVRVYRDNSGSNLPMISGLLVLLQVLDYGLVQLLDDVLCTVELVRHPFQRIHPLTSS